MPRFARHLALSGFDESHQKRLALATVGVVGAGGLGCSVLAFLAAAGVGRIILIDDDHVELSNLHRQILFFESDLGRKKAAAAAERLQKMHSKTEVEVILERLTAENALPFFEKCDLVLDGSDNFPTRYLCDDAAFLTQKPLVFGAVSGLEGQVSVFHFQRNDNEKSRAYRDLHPSPPTVGSVLSCSEAGVLGPVAGAVGAMMALEAIKILAQIGEPLAGRLWFFDGQDFTSRVLRFSKNEARPPVERLIDYDLFCGFVSGKKMESKSIYPAVFEAFLAENPMTRIIDVREASEFLAEKWPNSENVPLAFLEKTAQNWPREKPIILLCQSGKRSAAATDILEKMGFENLKNVKGGLGAMR